MTRKEEMRKVSRDCYVSYKGNRYSVPWKYAGRESRIIEESSILKIEIDSVVVADHSILTGTGRISRNKEHFEGLLKAVREENLTILGCLIFQQLTIFIISLGFSPILMFDTSIRLYARILNPTALS